MIGSPPDLRKRRALRVTSNQKLFTLYNAPETDWLTDLGDFAIYISLRKIKVLPEGHEFSFVIRRQ